MDQDSSGLIACAFDQGDDAVLVADAKLVIRHVNRAFSATVGASSESLLGRRVGVLADGEPPAALEARLARVLERREPLRRVGVERRRGAAFAEIAYLPLLDGDERPIGIVWRERNVTRREQRLRRLETAIGEDALTGLANRQRLLYALAQAHRAGQRAGARARLYALIYIDLDGFKRVNDLFGHACGDEVLAVIGERLGRAVRAGELIARVGGDEFVALAPQLADPRDALVIARRLLDAIGEPIDTEHGVLPVGASAGIAIGPEDGEGEVLLAAADAAMYRAKRVGGGRAALARPLPGRRAAPDAPIPDRAAG